MSRKQLKKRSESVTYDLPWVSAMCCIYGLKGLMEEADSYLSQIDDAVNKNDKSLCCSAVKLASRFLATAAAVLSYHVGADLRDMRMSSNLDSYRYMCMCNALKHLTTLL